MHVHYRMQDFGWNRLSVRLTFGELGTGRNSGVDRFQSSSAATPCNALVGPWEHVPLAERVVHAAAVSPALQPNLMGHVPSVEDSHCGPLL